MLNNLRGLLTRRFRLFIILFLLVCLVGLVVFRPKPTLYRGEVRFIIGQNPLESTTELEQERFYNWTTSEYIVAGVSDWANGTQFADALSRNLQAQGYDLQPLDVIEFVDAGYARSRLIIAVQHEDERMVETIAFAASEVLLTQGDFDIPQVGNASAEIFPIDNQIEIQEADNSADFVTRAIMILAVAFLAGLFATIFSELLDPTIRTRAAAESLDLPILGEIPK